MAKILGSVPAEQARAFDGRLRELAMSVCRNDSRTYEQRRADALFELTNGSQFLPCNCGRADCPQDRSGGVVVRRPVVHVVMTDSTLHGGGEPAHLDGYGVISAEHARDIARDAVIRNVRAPADDVAEPVPASARVYRPGAVLDTWLRIIAGSCQWLHCDVPAWNSDLDHNEPFHHGDPECGGKTVASNMSAFCRNHHRLKHSDRWRFTSNVDRTMSLTSPTGHCYRTRPAGLMAGSHEPTPPQGGRNRRTQAENKAARIQSERNRQRRRIQKRAEEHVQYKRRKSPRARREPIDYGDDPPPF